MSVFINGVEHWLYDVQLVLDSAGQAVRSAPGKACAPGSSTALTVYSVNLQPLEVQTNSLGLRQQMYAPVFPRVESDFGAVGPGGEAVRMSATSEDVGNGLVSLAAQLPALTGQSATLAAVVLALGKGPQGTFGSVADRIEALEDRTTKLETAAPPGGGDPGDPDTPAPAAESRLSYLRFELTVPASDPTPETPTPTTGIPAVDGAAKWRFGGNHDDAAPDDDGAGTSSGGQYNGQRITTLDKRLFSTKKADGTLNAPTRRCGYVREYWDGPHKGSIPRATGKALSGLCESSKVEQWTREGRVGLLSFKKGQWSMEQWANRDAGLLTELRALARWLKTLPAIAAAAGKGGKGEHDVSFWHEPEEFATLAEAKVWRQACRTFIEVLEEEGVTNIAPTAPMYVAVNDFKNKDFRLWHPEWDDDLKPILKADGTRRPYIKKFGIDWYNPHVNVATNRIDGVPQKAGEIEDNHTWKEDVLDTILADYIDKGGRPMPMVIGEFGLYTQYHQGGYGESLESTGVTMDLILSDLVDDGVYSKTFPVTGIAFWNSNECRFSDDKDWKRNASDAWGIKHTAVRQVTAGMILRTNAQSPRGAGKRVLPSDAEAHRSWVVDPRGSSVVSVPA